MAQQAPLRRRVNPAWFLALSLDAAQILAPVAPGPFPAAAPSPAGDAPEGGDFAALLGSLAGALQVGPGPEGGAPAGAGAGLEAPLGLAAAGRRSPVEPASRVDVMKMSLAPLPEASPVAVVSAETSRNPVLDVIPAAPGPDDEDILAKTELDAGRSGDRLPLEQAALLTPPPSLLPAPVRSDDAGMRTPVAAHGGPPPSEPPLRPSPSPAPSPARGQTVLKDAPPAAPSQVAALEIPAGMLSRETPASLDSTAGRPVDPSISAGSGAPQTPPSGDVVSDRPQPGTAAQAPPRGAESLALTAGVIRVTGQMVPDGTARPVTETTTAPGPAPAGEPEAPVSASRTAEVARPPQTPLQTPPQAQVQAASPPAPAEARAPEEKRVGGAPRADRAVTREAEGTEGGDAPAPAQAGGAIPARPVDPTAPPSRATVLAASSGGGGAVPEPEEDLSRPAGPEAALPAAAPAGSAQVRAESPEAPPAPVRASVETLASLAAQMARRLDDGTTRFNLELNPGDLGRVDVRLEISASGGVRAAFTFENAHAASELGRRADELQKSLETAGFNLSGGVSFDVAGDRSQGRSPAWTDARDDRRPSSHAPEPELPREGRTDLADALTGRRISARTGVDIRI